jgi:hypothetical protein
LRPWLFEERKRVLASLLRQQRDGISFNGSGCRVEPPPSSSANQQPVRFSRIKTT